MVFLWNEMTFFNLLSLKIIKTGYVHSDVVLHPGYWDGHRLFYWSDFWYLFLLVVLIRITLLMVQVAL